VPRLVIIIGSTRPGRVGLPVADWFAARARAHGGFEVEVADLAEIALPLLDEPNHPRLGQYTKAHTRRWSETIAAADAIVLVTSEYNHSYPAALKNALDYLNREWRDKPVGFVTYGGISAGTRAMVALKVVVTALAMHPVLDAVNIPFVQQFLSDEGEIQANEIMETAATALLDALVRYDGALRPLRG
jgi:NAD(P)H-dependent FMN reductase